ncbi:MAG: aminotransferase class V-fold PLP-dependent enzyme [SAR202 cluster bacterium]|nr:aminotransferase class V-fold PLP-dependent enzyme [SAR202 cluster bacterium]
MSSNSVYSRLGVRPIINAASWRSGVSGSLMPDAVVKAMAEASRSYVDIYELNRKAGEVIAKLTGAEAGMVTAGASAAMLLEAAACIAGKDPAKISRLPDTEGMKNEIIIHHAHRIGYEINFRAAGAKLVMIGDTHHTTEWMLESAINDRTAAVAYVIGPRPGGALPMPEVVRISHSRGVPVIVDAASMLPPPENLTRFVAMGPDLVCFSGGKGVRGPQSSGILCGKKEFIEAATLNASPYAAIGRPAKVSKEEIVGLVTALELFVDTDFDALTRKWLSMAEYIASEVAKVPGLTAVAEPGEPEHLEFDTTLPRVVVKRDSSKHRLSTDDLVDRMASGDPSIRVVNKLFTGGFFISPVTLQDGEPEIIVRRIREIMTAR